MVNGTDSLENLPQTTKPEHLSITEELFNEGLQRYEHNDIAGAIDIYENLTNTNPELVEAQVNLGNAYFKADRIDDAINCWKNVLSIDSSHINCYINLGNAFFAKGNTTEAIEQWQTALTIAPNHPTILRNIGAAYEKLNDKSNSFKYYEKYLTYCTKNVTQEYYKIQEKVTQSRKLALNCIRMGVRFQKVNNLRSAAKYYIKAIDIYPNYAKAHLNMGSICYLAEKYEHAIKYWLESVKIDPAYDSTYFNLAIAYEKIKKYSYAYCMYTRFLTASVSKKIEEKDTVKQRIEALKSLITQEEIQKHISIGDKFSHEQKYYEAILEYENYTILRPNQRNLVEDKIKHAKSLLNPEKNAALKAYEIGMACFEQKKYDKAYKALNRYLFFDLNGEFSAKAHAKIEECAMLLSDLENQENSDE